MLVADAPFKSWIGCRQAQSFVKRLPGVTVMGAASEIANVNQVFHPAGGWAIKSRSPMTANGTPCHFAAMLNLVAIGA